jgi:23S rRNA (cytidine2498-2'-O)-methyltransferase
MPTRDTGRVLFSAADESFDAAVRELRDEFGKHLQVERLGPDAGVVETGASPVAEIAAACRTRPLMFPRHLTVEVARVPRKEAEDLDAVADAARPYATPDVAVQTWVSGSPRLPYSAGELASRVGSPIRSGAERTLSACITEQGVSLGVNRTEDSLADWPGGRVRLGKRDGQVSRAEFKLEELMALRALDLPGTGDAVDLGAAPGGWTRILRSHGLRVHAVDPADLDRRLAGDRGIRHVRTTAGEFLRATDRTFDIAVNDMRMEPELSCRVMLDAAERLRPGGLAVVTLKIGTRLDVARRCLELLRRRYRIDFARQLHHNRHEVTVVGTAR